MFDRDRGTVTCNIGVLFAFLRQVRSEHGAQDTSIPPFSATFSGYHYIILPLGDLTQDDSQRRFFAQHSVAMLEQCCNQSKQSRNNVEMMCCVKNRRCKSSRVTSHLIFWYLILLRFASILRPPHASMTFSMAFFSFP